MLTLAPPVADAGGREEVEMEKDCPKIKTQYVQRTYKYYHFAKDIEDDDVMDGWELVCVHNARILGNDFYIATFRRNVPMSSNYPDGVSESTKDAPWQGDEEPTELIQAAIRTIGCLQEELISLKTFMGSYSFLRNVILENNAPPPLAYLEELEAKLRAIMRQIEDGE